MSESLKAVSATSGREAATLRRVSRYAQLMDSAVRIPFTRITFGLDGMLGLIPVVGDLTGLVLSGYLLVEAQQVGASRRVKVHMVKNMLIDATVGSIPLLGDAFDVMYKANLRNAALLRKELEQRSSGRSEG